MLEQWIAFAETRTGQTALMLVGTALVWGCLLWIKRILERRLSRHRAFVLRHLSAPIHFGFLFFAVSIAIQIFPKEIARHPFARYGVRIGLIVSIVWATDRLISVLLRRSALGNPSTSGSRDLVHTLVRTVLFSISTLVICDTLGISITPILASLGVGSVAVALALQGTLGDFFSGIYLIVDRPVHGGDFVRLESGIEGQVVRIGWRSTELRQVDDRMVIVPNSKLASSQITNLSLPKQAYVFKVSVSVGYRSDLAQVQKALEDECAEVGATEPKVRFTEFGDHGIGVTLFAQAADFDAHFTVRSNLIAAIHRRFQKDAIEIPYPQQVNHQAKA